LAALLTYSVERRLIGHPIIQKQQSAAASARALWTHLPRFFRLASGDKLRLIGPAGEDYTVSLSRAWRANNAEVALPLARADLGMEATFAVLVSKP
jgi:hypothetical protein